MALPAGGMTFGAVVVEGGAKDGVVGEISPSCFQASFKASQRCMKIDFTLGVDITVAGVAVQFGGVYYHPLMRLFFQLVQLSDSALRERLVLCDLHLNTAIALVADHATHLAMGAFNKFSITDEDPFPYLQRR